MYQQLFHWIFCYYVGLLTSLFDQNLKLWISQPRELFGVTTVFVNLSVSLKK